MGWVQDEYGSWQWWPEPGAPTPPPGTPRPQDGYGVPTGSVSANPGALGRAAPRTHNADGSARVPQQSPTQQIQARAQQDAARSDAFWEQNQQAQADAARQAAFNSWIEQGALSARNDQRNQAIAGYQGIAGNVRNDATAANARSNDLYTQLVGQQNALNQQDQAGYDRYMQETNPLMTRLSARGSNPADIARQMDAYNVASGISGGSLDYQAAQYASNPADIARQEQMYQALYGVGQGSLDYTAEQWRSNPADVRAQQAALQRATGIADGSLDYESQAAQAFADPRDLAEQREARDKYKSLSDPSVTAQERFLAEMARRKFETDDRSSRQAVSESLAARGLRSGGQQIAMQQSARQQIAQDRVLAELGMQANAVGRSMQALEGYGGMSTAMRNASFDEAYKRGVGADNASANNQAVQFGGAQLEANQSNAIRGANDQVGMFNTNQSNVAQANNQNTRLSGYMGAANQSNAIRSANDYVGTFNTGQVNNARANNQATRLGGAQLQANQSNAIRTANDEMSQFQDIYNQNESYRLGSQAQQRASQGLATTAQIGGRNERTTDTGLGVNSDNYGRNQDANKAGWDAITNSETLNQGAYNDLVGWTGRTETRAQGGLNNATNSQVLRSNDPSTQRWVDALRAQEDDEATRRITGTYGY